MADWTLCHLLHGWLPNTCTKLCEVNYDVQLIIHLYSLVVIIYILDIQYLAIECSN